MTAIATSTIPAKGTWVIDQSHTTVEFVARHMVVAKVKGRFANFEGTIDVGDTLSAHAVTVKIDAASIDTRDATRDEHLRSADFLDVEHHREIIFNSTAIESAKGDKYTLLGDLTIRGVTKQVSLEFDYLGSGVNPFGENVAVFEARTSINRKEFGLEWNVALEAGGVLVGDKVDINLDIEAKFKT